MMGVAMMGMITDDERGRARWLVTFEDSEPDNEFVTCDER